MRKSFLQFEPAPRRGEPEVLLHSKSCCSCDMQWPHSGQCYLTANVYAHPGDRTCADPVADKCSAPLYDTCHLEIRYADISMCISRMTL